MLRVAGAFALWAEISTVVSRGFSLASVVLVLLYIWIVLR